jgi:DNA-binding CsgD family transcriptional regulator
MERRIRVREDPEKSGLYVTVAELAIVKEIAEGKTSREIAEERKVSYKTVEAQRRDVLRRLACKNMPHLITTLFREKILL